MQLIAPQPVERNAIGEWHHPDVPWGTFRDGSAFRAWLKEQGLEVGRKDLEDEDPDHPAYKAYYSENGSDLTQWDPTPPEGEGWFTLCIDDTEDGPQWWWARRV